MSTPAGIEPGSKAKEAGSVLKYFLRYYIFILLNCDLIYVWNVISVYSDYFSAYISIYLLPLLINYDPLML